MKFIALNRFKIVLGFENDFNQFGKKGKLIWMECQGLKNSI